MKNAVIIHGKPTEERYNDPSLPKPHEANWLPWIGEKLEERGVHVSIPAMPRPYYPDYEAWEAVFKTLVVNSETALIGHSAGAEFILRYLSQNPTVSAGHVALVAPYRDEAGKYGDFSKYELDPTLGERIGKLTILNSLDDTESIQNNANRIAGIIPRAKLIELNGYGHFMIGNAMTSPEFPTLLEILTGK